MTVAVIGAGEMGAAIGARLSSRGARVLTSLEGRSAASRRRAAEAGMQDEGASALADAAILLSIVPPAEAEAAFERALPLIRLGAVYVDCNAVSPAKKRRLAERAGAEGRAFVDAAIVGRPPQQGRRDPIFYAAGDAANSLLVLRDFGLDLRVLEGEIGAAAAVKLCHSGISKGLSALTVAMLEGVGSAGVAEAARAELVRSLPSLFERGREAIPPMFAKAERWADEMREIADFLSEQPSAAQSFAAIAELYEAIAAQVASGADQPRQVTALLAGSD